VGSGQRFDNLKGGQKVASNLYTLIETAHKAIVLLVEEADTFEWLVEKINSPTATAKDQKDFRECCAYGLALQEFLDDLRAEFDGYIRLADNDFARLGLTHLKAKAVKDFMEATTVRPFEPLEKLDHELGEPALGVTLSCLKVGKLKEKTNDLRNRWTDTNGA
jgi:CelD/BcsL family acetyltransferase involved in cellulose biosynthesis